MKRCCCIVVASLGASLLSFVLGLLAIAIGSLSPDQATVPAACRIVSSSVDIKSSRVCELGFLNYKARHASFPKEKATFRCHDDYYWASVFEVEFKEYFSGQTLHAVAEAPKEALPQSCRPSFGTAWMTKMKFKVNGTYNCRYILGSQKADIYPDRHFNCQANDTSTAEMARRFFILLTRWHSERNSPGCQMGYYSIGGIVLGMLASLWGIILVKIVHAGVSSLTRQWRSRKHRRLHRACFLVAYFSVFACLLSQY